MSDYEKQIQATAKSYDPELHKTEKNGGEILSSEISETSRPVPEWADVLRELEPYY